MTQWIKHVTFSALIFLISFAFLLPLFYPTQSILITPDFKRSDAYHSSFSTKMLLSQALQMRKLPLWSDKLASGFPLLGEGQIGIFFLPNILCYLLFPGVAAYSLTLVIALATFGIGTYAVAIQSGFRPLLALFAGITGTLFGPSIAHLTHISLLQSFSLFPWMLVMTQLLIQKPHVSSIVLMSLIGSQQFLAGSPQPAVITWIAVAVYYVYLTITTKRTIRTSLALLFLVCLCTLGLSAIQIVPSMEFLQETSAPHGFSASQGLYQFPLKHLATYINPFQLGNPKYGTYFAQQNANTSIFWENTGYIGLLPLLFAVLAIGEWVATGLPRPSRPMLLALGILLLLMLGMNSPLYIIYSYWPFTLFHVSSRFIFVFSFVLLTIGIYGMHTMIRLFSPRISRIWMVVLIIIQLFDIFSTWNGYHLFGNASDWLQKPSIASVLTSQPTVLSLDADYAYHTEFNKGWNSIAPYQDLQNLLSPNMSAYWGIQQFDVITGRPLWRQSLVASLLFSEITRQETIASISATGEKFMEIYPISAITTTRTLVSQQYTEVTSQKTPHNTLRVYTRTSSRNPAYLASHIVSANTFEEAQYILQSDVFIPGKSVLVETPQPSTPSSENTGSVTLIADTDTVAKYRVSANSYDTIAVVPRAYYPGWQAIVDGTLTSIVPANINQMGILVPKGDHIIMIVYRPNSFIVGIALTITTVVILFAAMVFLPVFLNGYIHQKIALTSTHLSRSHDR